MKPIKCEVVIERSGDAWRACIKMRDNQDLVQAESFHTYRSLSDVLLDVREAAQGLG